MPVNDSVILPFVRSHAFIVGIDDYEALTPLRTAVNDAKGLAERLKAQHGYEIYGPLLNPTKAELEKLLQETIPKEVGPNDRVIFYFAGHGIALSGEEGKNGYLVPVDAKDSEIDSLISMNELHETIEGLPCNHGILILDCCFSGAFKWSTGYRDGIIDMPNIVYEERFWRYCKDPAWQVITSSAYDQKAVDVIFNQSIGMREEGKGLHSPFAEALFQALDGAGDVIPPGEGDGVITASELYTYLRDAVETETTEKVIRQSPSMFTLRKHDKGEYIFLNPRHRLNLPPFPGRNPFKGLKSYNEEDVAFFFGRDRVTKKLVKKVSDSRFIVVSGASGTGKSSVIKAGLLPRLRKKGWEILPVIRPGKEPMQVLANELGDFTSLIKGKEKAILIVDQYEELITQCLHEVDRDAFEQQLANWLERYPQLTIILSVRSDFEPQFDSQVLAKWWEKGRYVIPVFKTEEIREIIRKPALQSVLFYEPDDLKFKIEEEVGQAPGALPLLSFMLSELYLVYKNSGREDRALTVEDYKKIGGFKGALRTKADNVYKTQDEAHKNSLRRLMLRMVSLAGDEPAGKRVYEEELIFSDESESHRIKEVANKMVDARLIISGRDKDGEIYLEPAHDALVRSWGRLREWIKTVGEEKLIWQNKFSEAVVEYWEMVDEEARKARNLLWTNNPRLDILKVELEEGNHYLNAHEESFVRKSVRRRTFRQRLGVSVSSGLVIIFGFLAFWANRQTGIAKEKTDIANQQTNIAKEKTKDALYSDSITQCQIIETEVQNILAKASEKEAQKQEGIAQQKTQAATATAATALSWNAQFLYTQDHTKALNLALAAVKLAPIEETQTILNGILYNLNSFFYQKKFEIPELEINQIAFTPDGKYFLSAGADAKSERENVAILWNIENGKRERIFTKHHWKINSAAISPDGELVLTGGDDKVAYLSELKTGRLIQKFRNWGKYEVIVSEVAFSPKGRYLILGLSDNSVELWERNSNRKNFTRKKKHKTKSVIRSFAFSPDEKSVVFGNPTLRWNIDSNNNPAPFLEYEGDDIGPLSFSPDGKYIFSGCDDWIGRLWDSSTGKLIRNFIGHTDKITSSSFSPNGRLIVTGSSDQTAKVWETISGVLIKTLEGHTDQVRSVAISDDAKYILTGSKDQTVKLWKTPSLLRKKTFSIPANNLSSLAIYPENKFLLIGGFIERGKNPPMIWDIESDVQFTSVSNKELKGPYWGIHDVAFSSRGKYFLIGGEDKENPSAFLYQKDNSKIKLIKKFRSGFARSVTFSSENQYLAIGFEEKFAEIWEQTSQDPIDFGFKYKLKNIAPFRAIAFSPNRQFIATGLTPTLWQASTGDSIRVFSSHQNNVGSIAFSPNGKHLLGGLYDGSAKLWNVSTGRIEQVFSGHEGGIMSVAFSPDGKYVITGSWDKTARIWEASTGQMVSLLNDHTNSVTSVAFAPNGKSVFTVSKDKTVIQWNVIIKPSFPDYYRFNQKELAEFKIDWKY